MSTNWLTDTRKIVGCDIDDVLADFVKGFMLEAQHLYGANPELRPTSWEWDDCEMSADKVDGTWNHIIHDSPNWWESLDVESGVDLVTLHTLFNKHRMYFPTARANNVGKPIEIQTARWMFDKLDLMHPTIIVSGEKGPLATALKYEWFIDDRPKNCIDIKKVVPNCKVFMKTATHNIGVVLPDIPRVANFNEFAKLVLAE